MVDPSTNTETANERVTTTTTTPGSSGRGSGRGRSGGRGYRHYNNSSKSSTGSSNNNNGSGSQMIDSLREACPAHKQNQLVDLIKELNGDEEKIRQKISEWWDEPITPSEGDWAQINKKSQTKNATTSSSKSNNKVSGRGGRGSDGGAGRGRGTARGNSGREGRGRDGRGRGRGERAAAAIPTKGPKPSMEETTPVTTETTGANAEDTLVVQPSVVANNDVENISSSKVEPTILEITPAPVVPAPKVPTPVNPTLSTANGNVWATRGSAHLIKAEKPAPPKPIVPPAAVGRKTNNGSMNNGDRTTTAPTTTLNIDVQVVSSVAPEKTPVAPPTTSIPSVSSIAPEPVVAPTLLSALSSGVPTVPSSLTSSSLNTPGITTSTLTTSNTPAINAWNQDAPSDSIVSSTNPSVSEPKPTPVLNMGRWETGDTDDDLDFGFGFDTSAADITDTHVDTKSINSNNAAVSAATAASPARPPPGLSMSGMPPMPANAVLVHELENKLEEVSISKPQQQHQVHDNTSSLSGFTPTHHPSFGGPTMPDSSLSSQPLYGANPYTNAAAGGIGMYGGYNNPGAGGNAGSAIPSHAFMPSSGNLVVPQQPKAPVQQQQQQQPQQQPQQSLYNSAPSSGNAPTLPASAGVGSGVGVGGSNETSTTNLPTNTTSASTMPPGMTGGMPYGNHMYYGQQPFVMGQHQPNIGYSYGYGNQFGGGVQSGGFGYPGNIHGNSGYGHAGPSYDDHTGVAGSAGHGNLPGSGAVGGLGGYDHQQQPKNTGGYRGGGGGRHNNNQYQPYNPQQQHHQIGGYGAQPYGMGYHGDHFNQRGGYQNIQDHYGMQQQQQGVGNYGGFQGDNQYKGKKNNRGGGGLNQFQQQGQPIVNQAQHMSGQQQSFGLQGQGGGVGADSNQPGTDSWSNQNVGWSGGAGSGWQAK